MLGAQIPMHEVNNLPKDADHIHTMARFYKSNAVAMFEAGNRIVAGSHFLISDILQTRAEELLLKKGDEMNPALIEKLEELPRFETGRPRGAALYDYKDAPETHCTKPKYKKRRVMKLREATK